MKCENLKATLACSIGFSIGIIVVLWMFYGFGCILWCGMTNTVCEVKYVGVRVQVCNDGDGTYAYQGYASFCFDAFDEYHEKSYVCIDQDASCASTRSEALKKVQERFPVGYNRTCSYDIVEGGTYWNIRSSPDTTLWFKVSAIFSVVLTGLIVVFSVCWLALNYCECSCRKRQGYQ